MPSGAKACKSCRSRPDSKAFKRVFTCKIRLRYSRERASQICQKLAKSLVSIKGRNIIGTRTARQEIEDKHQEVQDIAKKHDHARMIIQKFQIYFNAHRPNMRVLRTCMTGWYSIYLEQQALKIKQELANAPEKMIKQREQELKSRRAAC